MSTILLKAFNQWCDRPKDERFETLESLRDATAEFKRLAVEREGVPLESLRTVAEGPEVKLVGKGNVPASMTHWSFGQLSSAVQAPAGFLRKLAPTVATNVLNHLLAKVDPARKEKLLFASNGAHLMRAFTSDGYKRIWDADVAQRLIELRDRSRIWQPAPAGFDGGRGLYASDHDLFAFMVDNGRRIFEKQEGGLSRGFFVWNSEVGATSFGMQTFFYEWICGNHRVVGATGVRTFRIPHVGTGDRRAFYAIERAMADYASASAVEDERRIEAAHRFEFGANKEEVVEAVFTMKKRPGILSRETIAAAFDRAEQRQERYGAPTTAWGLTGGMTELSQEPGRADERVELDRAAGKVLEMAF